MLAAVVLLAVVLLAVLAAVELLAVVAAPSVVAASGPEEMSRRGPSAALVLGLLAGVLAAFTVLPTAVPLIAQLRESEQRLALQYASSATHLALWQLAPDGSLPDGVKEQLGVETLTVSDLDGNVVYSEGLEPPHELEDPCTSPTGGSIFLDRATGRTWCASCLVVKDMRIVAATKAREGYVTQVAWFVLSLSLVVGIITALVVLRVLAPLSRMSNAIARVSQGERGVTIPETGLAELDDLVNRVNALARATEAREEAITDRIQVSRQLSRMVAHEVRNPLQSLELLTTLIQDEDDEVERDELAVAIRDEIKNLNAVVLRLLRRDPRQQLQLRRANRSVGKVAEDVVSLYRPEARRRGVVLSADVAPACSAEIDPTLVRRSIENLVVNAMEAVADGTGKVQVNVIEGSEGWVHIEVDDNGPGGGTIGHMKSPMGGARFMARLPIAAREAN